MAIPRPGQRVRGSRTGRPIMALLDLLARRWAMRVMWELREGPATFRALQDRCEGLSPSVLNTRIAELREARLVEDGEDGYQLSALGAELVTHWLPLVKWADKWAQSLKSR